MSTIDLSILDDVTLSKRLRALAGEERNVQADFLLHLDALDRRRGFAKLGYPSLWEFCCRALHLREGAASRRIGAMRALRRFPRLEGALRDGSLALSTLCVLAPALTEDNVAELAERAAFKTKAETEAIVAALKPRSAPADGLRRVAAAIDAPRPVVPAASAEPLPRSVTPRTTDAASVPLASPPAALPSSAVPEAPSTAHVTSSSAPAPPTPRPYPAELQAIAAERWSLRVTLDAEAKRDLELLTDLLAHKIPRRDVAAVLKEALRCAVEKHGKRRGAVPPERPRAVPDAANQSLARDGARAIPAHVRRDVWARDGGRCTFIAPDGTPCGSRWKLEFDHVDPRAMDGPTTAANLRLRCRTHNLLHAEQVFGARYMARFRASAEG